MYDILPYSYNMAKKLDVIIKPSTNPKKKIDVFKNDKRIASIGSIKYSDSDYPHYMKEQGKEYADKRRSLYHQRHKGSGINQYYAKRILW